tara:strand:- start:9600 stop:10376 length:777 start_codon:yes stop_codon:yes gene_type:complete
MEQLKIKKASEAAPHERPENAESAWEFSKKTSRYHFRTDVIDPRWDCVQGIGRFVGDWTQELEQAEASATPVNLATRRYGYTAEYKSDPTKGYKSSTVGHATVKENTGEHKDMEKAGGDKDRTIFRTEHDLSPTFQRMVDMIGLDKIESRLHVQMPTECFTGHVDRFHWNYPDEDPYNMMRIQVMLKDWQQGHFFQFGNFPYQQWRAGDISTFEWRHVPHYTANCGLTPRVTLFITGVITPKTTKFIADAKEVSEIPV